MALFTRTRLALLGLAASAGSAFAQSPAPAKTLPVAPANPVAVPVAPAEPCCDTTAASVPYGGPARERPVMTGDWFCRRECLRDCGWTIDAYSTNFYQGITGGGLLNDFQFGGRFDLLLNIDGEKAGLWKGLFITLHDETLYGKNVNSDTGALMPVSLGQFVPQPDGTVNALTGVKITQGLSENFAVFFGKLNLLDEFKQPYAGYRGVDGFMNTAFNFPVIAARTLPYSSYGAGFAVLRDREPVLSFMVLDTNNTPTTSGFNSFFDNGVSMVGMVNIPTCIRGKPGHQGIGGSYSNRAYTNLEDLPYVLIQNARPGLPPAPLETGSWSVWYAFDQSLRQVCCDPNRTWGLFGNAGISDGNPNPIRWSANAGIGGASPAARRPYDSFGVAYYYLGLSDSIPGNRLGDENGVEAYYTVGFSPWCKVTADFQAVNPTRRNVDTAIVFGVRAKIDF